jgi:transcriptional regulator with XRE-family HTH domain
MGRRARPKAERLAGKLLQIRNALGLSQSEMFKRLEVESVISYKQISKYELGITEPPLIVLVRYARVSGIHVEDIIDDTLDLPNKLPGPLKYKGGKRTKAS